MKTENKSTDGRSQGRVLTESMTERVSSRDFEPGVTVGRLTLLEKMPWEGRIQKWRCKCRCGTEKKIRSSAIAVALTRSCGCYRREQVKGPTPKHGYSSKSSSPMQTKMHQTYMALKSRTSPGNNSHDAKRYRGRGIFWSPELTFSRFCKEVGLPPENSRNWQIDRIDNDKGYEPGNLRWATAAQQARNRTTTVFTEDTAWIVLEQYYNHFVGPTALAMRFRCSTGAIYGIVRGRTWRDVYAKFMLKRDG